MYKVYRQQCAVDLRGVFSSGNMQYVDVLWLRGLCVALDGIYNMANDLILYSNQAHCLFFFSMIVQW